MSENEEGTGGGNHVGREACDWNAMKYKEKVMKFIQFNNDMDFCDQSFSVAMPANHFLTGVQREDIPEWKMKLLFRKNEVHPQDPNLYLIINELEKRIKQLSLTQEGREVIDIDRNNRETTEAEQNETMTFE